MSAPAQLLQNSALQAAAQRAVVRRDRTRLGTLEPALPASARQPAARMAELALDARRFDHRAWPRAWNRTSLATERGDWIGLGEPPAPARRRCVDLVAGLLQPQSGAHHARRRAARRADRFERWRAGLAYVGQDGTVFNDTVRGNLLAEGAPRRRCELWRALEIVGLGERVRAFPGGPRRAASAIAAASFPAASASAWSSPARLLRRPSLLILDEATAALDPTAKRELFERLRASSRAPLRWSSRIANRR